jgi:predicted DNA-binding antitoxin AbrB/MazE fold protein
MLRTDMMSIGMVRQLDAVFEAGILGPLEPLSLNEQQRVRLTLDDHPSQQPIDSLSERRDELSWLATKARPYAGQWVALSGSQLVAHGAEAATVRAAARAANVDRPLLVHLPGDEELPFGGW